MDIGTLGNDDRRHQLRTWVSKAVVYGVLLFALAVVLSPIYWMLITSLQPRIELFNLPPNYYPKVITFDHYETILFAEKAQRIAFLTYLKNSLIVCSGTTVLTLALSIPAGYGFSRFEFSGRSTIMYFVLLTQMFPIVMLLISYFILFRSIGLINTYIGLILPYLTITVPFSIWTIKGYFDKVPKDIEDAALIDGAGPMQALVRIMIPTISPGIIATAIFAFIMAWDEFIIALTLVSDNAMYTLPPGMQISFIGEFSIRWGDMMAASLVASFPVILIFIFLQRYLIEGMTAGAVKG